MFTILYSLLKFKSVISNLKNMFQLSFEVSHCEQMTESCDLFSFHGLAGKISVNV